jgi:hypothetical protein
VSAGFDITFLGNVVECRTEAEVSLRAAPAGADPLCALVYENESGAVVELFGVANGNYPPAGLNNAIEDAKRGLVAYVNRRGASPPDGLTAAGLSLWLLEKADGTAMGVKLRSAA